MWLNKRRGHDGRRWALVLALWLSLDSSVLSAANNVCQPNQDDTLTNINTAIQEAQRQADTSDINQLFWDTKRLAEKLVANKDKINDEWMQKEILPEQQRLAAALAPFGEKVTQDGFETMLALLSLYERWGDDKYKSEASIAKVAEFAPATDPGLVEVLGLKQEASLQSLRSALLNEVANDPAKLAKLQEVWAIIAQMEPSLSLILTKEEKEAFYKRMSELPEVEGGKLKPTSKFPGLNDWKNFEELLRQAGFDLNQVVVNPETGELVMDEQGLGLVKILREEILKDLKKQDLKEISLTEIITTLKRITAPVDSADGSSEGANFQEQVARRRDIEEERPKFNEFYEENSRAPDFKSNRLFGSSVDRQVRVMAGNLGLYPKPKPEDFDPLAYRHSIDDVIARQLHLAETTYGFNGFNIRLAYPDWHPNSYPEEPRLPVEALKEKYAKASSPEESMRIYEEEKAYFEENVLKPWYEKKKAYIAAHPKPDGVKENYDGPYKRQKDSGDKSVEKFYKSRDDMVKHVLLAQIVNASEDNDYSNTIPERFEGMMKYSIDDLARLHFITRYIPNFNLAASTEEIRSVVQEVAIFKHQLERVFIKAPIIRFESLEQFRNFAKMGLRPMADILKLIPGISPYAMGFCGGKERELGLIKGGEAKPVSIRDYEEMVAKADEDQLFPFCKFASMGAFQEAVEAFKKKLIERRDKSVAEFKERMQKFLEALGPRRSADFVKYQKELAAAKVELEKAQTLKDQARETAAKAQVADIEKKVQEAQDELTAVGAFLQNSSKIDFSNYSIPQLETLSFVLSRYTWDDSFIREMKKKAESALQAATNLATNLDPKSMVTPLTVEEARIRFKDETITEVTPIVPDSMAARQLAAQGKQVRMWSLKHADGKENTVSETSLAPGVTQTGSASSTMFVGPPSDSDNPVQQAQRKAEEYEAVPYLVLEWLWQFKPSSPSQTGHLLLTAQKLAAEEGLLLNFMGPNWRQYINVTNDGQRPNAIDVLDRVPIIQEAKARLGQFQGFAANFDSGNTNGEFHVPRIEWTWKQREQVLDYLRAQGIPTDDEHVQALMTQAADIIWFGMELGFRDSKELVAEKEADGRIRTRTTTSVKALRNLQKEYVDLYKGLRLPMRVVRTGDLAPVKKGDPLYRPDRDITDMEMRFIGGKIAKARQSLPHAVTQNLAGFDSLIQNIFNPANNTIYHRFFESPDWLESPEGKYDMRSEETKRDHPDDTVTISRATYHAFEFAGITPNEEMSRIFGSPEQKEFFRTVDEYSVRFFKNGRDLWKSLKANSNGLTQDEVQRMMDAFANDKWARTILFARPVNDRDERDVRDGISDHIVSMILNVTKVSESKRDPNPERAQLYAKDGVVPLMSPWRYDGTRNWEVIRKQVKMLQELIISGANLFDGGISDLDKNTKQPLLHRAIDLYGPAAAEALLYSPSIDDSTLPQVELAPIVQSRLQTLISTLAYPDEERFTPTDEEYAALAKAMVAAGKSFNIDAFFDNFRRVADGEISGKDVRVVFENLPEAIRSQPALKKFEESLKSHALFAGGGFSSGNMRNVLLNRINERVGPKGDREKNEVDEKTRQVRDSVFGSVLKEQRAARVIAALRILTTSSDSQDQQLQFEKMMVQMGLANHFAKVLLMDHSGSSKPWFLGVSGIDTPFDYVPETDVSRYKEAGVEKLSRFVWAMDHSPLITQQDKMKLREDRILEEVFQNEDKAKAAAKIDPATARTAVDLARTIENRALRIETGPMKRNYMWLIQEAYLRQARENEALALELSKNNKLSPKAFQEALQKHPRYHRMTFIDHEGPFTAEDAKKAIQDLGVRSEIENWNDPAALQQLADLRDLIQAQVQLVLATKKISEKMSVQNRLSDLMPGLIEDMAGMVAVAERYHIPTQQVLNSMKEMDSVLAKAGGALLRQDLDRMFRNEHFIQYTAARGTRAVAGIFVGAAAGIAEFIYEAADAGAQAIAYTITDDLTYLYYSADRGRWDPVTGQQKGLGPSPIDPFGEIPNSELLSLDMGIQWNNLKAMARGTFGHDFQGGAWASQHNMMSLDENGNDRRDRYRTIPLLGWQVSDHEAGKLGGFTFSAVTMGLTSIGRPVKGIVDATGREVVKRGMLESAVRWGGSKVLNTRVGQTIEKGAVWLAESRPIKTLDNLWPKINPRNWFPNTAIYPRFMLRGASPPSRTLGETLTKSRSLLGKATPDAVLAAKESFHYASVKGLPAAVFENPANKSWLTKSAWGVRNPQVAHWMESKLLSLGPKSKEFGARAAFLGFQSTVLTAGTMLPSVLWAPDQLGRNSTDMMYSAMDSAIESFVVLWFLGRFHAKTAEAAMKISSPKSPIRMAIASGLMKSNSITSWGIMHHIGRGVAQSAPPYAFLLTDINRLKNHSAMPLIYGTDSSASDHDKHLTLEDQQVIAQFWSSAMLGYFIVANNFWGGDPKNDAKGLKGTGQKIWRAMAIGQTTEQARQMRSLQEASPEELWSAVEQDIIKAGMFVKDPQQLDQIRDRMLDPSNPQGLYQMYAARRGGVAPDPSTMTGFKGLMFEGVGAPSKAEWEAIKAKVDAVFQTAKEKAEAMRIEMEGLGQQGNPVEKFRVFLANMKKVGAEPVVLTRGTKEEIAASRKEWEEWAEKVRQQLNDYGVPPEFLMVQEQGQMLTDAIRARLERIDQGLPASPEILNVSDGISKFGSAAEFDGFLRAVMFDPKRLANGRLVLEGRSTSNKPARYVSPKLVLAPKPGPEGQVQWQVLNDKGEEIGWERESVAADINGFGMRENTRSIVHEGLKMAFEFTTAGPKPVRQRWYSDGIEFIGRGGRSISIFNQGGNIQILYRPPASDGLPDKIFTSMKEAGPTLADMGIWVGENVNVDKDEAWRSLSEAKKIIEKSSARPEAFVWESQVMGPKGKWVTSTNRTLKWRHDIYETTFGADNSVSLALNVPEPDPLNPGAFNYHEIYIPLPAASGGREYEVKPEEGAIYIKDIFTRKRGTVVLPLLWKIDVNQGKVFRLDPKGEPLGEPIPLKQFAMLSDIAAREGITPTEYELSHMVLKHGVMMLNETLQDNTNYQVTPEDLLADLKVLGLGDRPVTEIDQTVLEAALKKFLTENDPAKSADPRINQKVRDGLDSYKRLNLFFETIKVDFYDTLGAPRGGTMEQIKTAYRTKAKLYHEDSEEFKKLDEQGQQNARLQWRLIQNAYEVLSNSESREVYDRMIGVSEAWRAARPATSTDASASASTPPPSP